MSEEEKNNKKKYGRSHEECDGCVKENIDPQQCSGHAVGPVHCPEFVNRDALKRMWIYLLISCEKLLRADPSVREEIDAAIDEIRNSVEKIRQIYAD